ncbi:Pr6Pr family membrane protein [Yinghuangia seranimata]|uniref:Pr6Pr family membrane protein n=1 Tax=Yinghuangia seranimata TaxID=408067 RepID=UPI00248ADC3E|nr:Pr6Pr family membrane protein [Yinghuangia seranimata]MDI2130342.1 Pr6Pr family membrane protein [Yinghuangia seranimata]
MTGRMWVNVLRVVFGLLAAAALGAAAVEAPTAGAFVSDFTVLAAAASCALLLYLGVQGLREPPDGAPSRLLDNVRGAVVLYLAVPGIVFGLLPVTQPSTLAVPWATTVMDGVLPLVLAADWLLTPPSRPVSYQDAAGWLVFPLAYTAYALIRGAATGDYPYPFLDPAVGNGGYGRVTGAVFLLLVLFVAVGSLVRQLGSTLATRPGPTAEAV